MATKGRSKFAATAASAVVAVLATLVPALPAFAQHGGSASVNVHDIMAGTTAQEFQVTVAHAAGQGGGNIITPAPVTPAINYVDIFSPLSGYRIIDVIPPTAAWTGKRIHSNSRGAQLDGGSIAPSASAVFKVIADVPAAAKDRAGDWQVQVSSDGGATGGTPLTGALNTVIRVLSVDALAITGPGGVLDGSATGGQSGLTLSTTVRNAANTALPVSVNLTDNQGKVQENSQTPADPVSILAGASRAVNFNVSLGSTSSTLTTQLKVDANSGADSNTGPFFKTQNLIIEPAVALSYVTDSLSPRAVRPLQTGVQFSLRVNKTGVPQLNFNKANTELSFAGVTLDLVSPDSIDRNPQNNVLLTFQSTSIPNLPNGTFNASLDVAGSDDNGAPVSIPDIATQSIRVDINPPTIRDLDSIPPASRVVGQPPAVKSGDTLGLSGQVDDISAVTGQLQGCGPADGCSIADAWLTVFPELDCSGTALGTINVKSNLTLGATGGVSGNFTGPYPAGSQCLQFTMRAADAVGFTTTSVEAGLTEVDLTAPKIVQAAAAKRTTVANPVPGQPAQTVQNTITVTFSECLGGASTPRDWTVDGNVVTNVGTMTCTGPGGTAQQDLTMANEFADDFASMSLSYAVAPVGGGTRYFDRVNLTLANQDIDILDRLAPLAATITKVNGMGVQDSKFWTNTQATTFEITGQRAVESGYVGQIFEEDNGLSGLQRSGANADRKIAEKQVQGSNCAASSEPNGPDNCTLVLTTDLNGGLSAGNAAVEELDKSVYVLTLDTAPASTGGPNVGPAVIPALAMDIKNALIASVTPQAGQIVVTFTEPIPSGNGRDFIADWHVLDTSGRLMTLSSVALGATNTSRVLNVNHAAYSPANVALVEYSYFGPAASRYKDRATNATGDQIVCLGDVEDDPRC